MSHVYPILLDVSQRRILIVGGGRVAARKAVGLVDAGAHHITVVAPSFVAGFPDAVKKVERAYESTDLDGATIVFAATDRASVNDQVVREARERNILVNRADAAEDNPGDFVTPAKYQEQNVLLTVSAASAALAASIRDALQRRWDPRWTMMATAMQEIRPWVRNSPGLSQEQRAVIFRLLATDDAMDVLDAGGLDALKNWLTEKHPELRDA